MVKSSCCKLPKQMTQICNRIGVHKSSSSPPPSSIRTKCYRTNLHLAQNGEPFSPLPIPSILHISHPSPTSIPGQEIFPTPTPNVCAPVLWLQRSGKKRKKKRVKNLSYTLLNVFILFFFLLFLSPEHGATRIHAHHDEKHTSTPSGKASQRH